MLVEMEMVIQMNYVNSKQIWRPEGKEIEEYWKIRKDRIREDIEKEKAKQTATQ